MDDPIFDPTDAESVVSYMERNERTVRAIVEDRHLALLAFIAGKRKIDIPAENLKEGFSSLHKYRGLVVEARRNLREGAVPSNWYEQVNSIIDAICSSAHNNQSVMH